MKKMRKLIPAFCMLLLSAVMLSTSTFAWFSMNTTVTATGMQVTAQASSSIAISADGTNFGASMTLANGPSTMNPVTMVDYSSATTLPVASIGTVTTTTSTKSSTLASRTTSSIKFYALTAANTVVNPDSANALKTMAASITAGDTATYFVSDETHHATDEMWLKYVAAAGSGDAAIDLNIKVTDTSRATELNINKALHIAFVIDNGTNIEVWNYDIGAITGAAVDTNADSTNDAFQYEKDITSFLTLPDSGAAVKITMYAWFEGEDTDCKTNNAVTVDTLTIDLTFTKQ